MQPAFLFLAVLLLLNGCAVQAATQEDKLQAFRQFLKAYRLENRVLSLSVAITKDDRVIFAEGIGWQDHDAEEPTTAQTS